MMRLLLLTAALSSVLAAAPHEQVSPAQQGRGGKKYDAPSQARRMLCTTAAVGAPAIAIAANDVDLYEGPALYIVPAVAVIRVLPD